jgi:CubicO group peptidase (beta-lactamase class C family)
MLLGKLVGIAAGKRIDSWAEEKLFMPIGIKEYYWKITPDNECDTEGGLYLSSHDLARIGYLMLRKGKWGEKQIVSEEWVKNSITPFVSDIFPANDKQDTGYGYQWWIPQTDPVIFAGNGYGGQFIMVSPKYDLVVVFNGWGIHESETSRSSFDALADRIIPATKL